MKIHLEIDTADLRRLQGQLRKLTPQLVEVLRPVFEAARQPQGEPKRAADFIPTRCKLCKSEVSANLDHVGSVREWTWTHPDAGKCRKRGRTLNMGDVIQ